MANDSRQEVPYALINYKGPAASTASRSHFHDLVLWGNPSRFLDRLTGVPQHVMVEVGK